MTRPTTDPEIAAMTRIAALLTPLDEATRTRVIWWVNDRYDRPETVTVGNPPTWSNDVAADHG